MAAKKKGTSATEKGNHGADTESPWRVRVNLARFIGKLQKPGKDSLALFLSTELVKGVAESLQEQLEDARSVGHREMEKALLLQVVGDATLPRSVVRQEFHSAALREVKEWDASAPRGGVFNAADRLLSRLVSADADSRWPSAGPQRFQDLELPPAIKHLRTPNTQGGDLVRLNQRLFEAAFPEVMQPPPETRVFRFGYGDDIVEVHRRGWPEDEARRPGRTEHHVLWEVIESYPARLGREYPRGVEPPPERKEGAIGRQALIEQVLNLDPDDTTIVPPELRRAVEAVQRLAFRLRNHERPERALLHYLARWFDAKLPWSEFPSETVDVECESGRWTTQTYYEYTKGLGAAWLAFGQHGPPAAPQRPPYFDYALIVTAHFLYAVMESADNRDPLTNCRVLQCDWCPSLYLVERGDPMLESPRVNPKTGKVEHRTCSKNCRKALSEGRSKRNPPKPRGGPLDSPFLPKK
jgi:hypothetical protein